MRSRSEVPVSWMDGYTSIHFRGWTSPSFDKFFRKNGILDSQSFRQIWIRFLFFFRCWKFFGHTFVKMSRHFWEKRGSFDRSSKMDGWSETFERVSLVEFGNWSGYSFVTLDTLILYSNNRKIMNKFKLSKYRFRLFLTFPLFSYNFC